MVRLYDVCTDRRETLLYYASMIIRQTVTSYNLATLPTRDRQAPPAYTIAHTVLMDIIIKVQLYANGWLH